MAELFLMRTVGGPCPGDWIAGSDVQPWPLPDMLSDPEWRGAYVKVRESQLDPQPSGSSVIRGAEYEWRPAS